MAEAQNDKKRKDMWENHNADADYFVQYGISNYEVDINDYQKIDNEYVFNESYDFDTTKINSIKDIGLGRLLIIAFEDGGRISIDTNCTGY